MQWYRVYGCDSASRSAVLNVLRTVTVLRIPETADSCRTRFYHYFAGELVEWGLWGGTWWGLNGSWESAGECGLRCHGDRCCLEDAVATSADQPRID